MTRWVGDGAGMRAPVVVGVDGSPGGLAAVDLAAAEAVRRGRPLRIVYAGPWAGPSGPADPLDLDAAAALDDEYPGRPGQVLDEARARAGDGPVRVAVEAVPGAPVRVLVAESAGAALLVVGQRGLGGAGGLVTARERLAGLARMVVGSVTLRLAARAACPVLVARRRPDGTSPPATAPVLIGVDGSAAGEPALGYAFEAAALYGVPLIAVHTWIAPVAEHPGDMLPLVYDPAVLAAEEGRVLSAALAPWQAKYPEVAVHPMLLRGRAPGALVEASGRARLAVVGARGRGGVPGLALGTVTHALLHHAACPVAVVHHVRTVDPAP